MKGSASAALCLCHLQDGTPLIKYGERGDKLYLIRYGKVKVLRPDDKGGRIEVAKLGRGSFVGERALIAGEALLRRSGKQRCGSVSAALVCTSGEAGLRWGVLCAGKRTLITETFRGDGVSRRGAGSVGQELVSLSGQRCLAIDTLQRHRVPVVCSSSGLHRQSKSLVNLWQGSRLTSDFDCLCRRVPALCRQVVQWSCRELRAQQTESEAPLLCRLLLSGCPLFWMPLVAITAGKMGSAEFRAESHRPWP